jgi:hypothetical protein
MAQYATKAMLFSADAPQLFFPVLHIAFCYGVCVCVRARARVLREGEWLLEEVGTIHVSLFNKHFESSLPFSFQALAAAKH